MIKLVIFSIGIFCCFFLTTCKAQNTTNSTVVYQNVTVTPNQIMRLNFKVPGAGILAALKWIKGFAHQKEDSFIGRCLGAARKLKFIMPFLLFKMGVIVTTLGFLTLFSLKGLAIGIILLLLNTGGLFGKLALLKAGFSHGHETHPKEVYVPHPAPSPAVHLHVHKDHEGHYNLIGHSDHSGHGGYSAHGSSYGSGPTAWSDRISKRLSESKTPAERAELMNLYSRLGFNVNALLAKGTVNAGPAGTKGVTFIYPGEVKRSSTT